MSDHEEDGRPERRVKATGGELILPIAALIFTLYYFSTIWRSPWEAQVAAFFVGSILTALILLFFVQTAVNLMRGRLRVDFSPLLQPARLNIKRLALFGLTVGYIALIRYLGFTITTFLFLSGGILLLQNPKRPLFAIGIAGLIALAGYLLFILAFNVRFPRGPFEELMRGIL
jgi:hypothetical protein